MDGIIEGIIAAVVSYAVPWLLKRILPDRAPGSAFPWFGWVLALTFGGVLGGIIAGAMGMQFEGYGNWAVLGMSLGVMGWIVAQRMGIGPWFAVGSALGWMITPLFQDMGFGHATWAVCGVLIGLLQWPAMRTVRGSFWWVPMSGIAWFAGGMVGLALGMGMVASGIEFGLAWIIGWGIVRGVGGAILAPLASWLWNRSRTETASTQQPQAG